MNPPKINPAVLRLLVIFPNILSYILLIGILVYILTNYTGLKAAEALNFWMLLLVLLSPITVYTSYSIVKRIKTGTL